MKKLDLDNIKDEQWNNTRSNIKNDITKAITDA